MLLTLTPQDQLKKVRKQAALEVNKTIVTHFSQLLSDKYTTRSTLTDLFDLSKEIKQVLLDQTEDLKPPLFD